MRHAIMIMTHTDWPALRRLVESMDNPSVDFIIHINKRSRDWDKSILDGATQYSKIYHAPRIKVGYCNYSQVEAIISLLSTAVKNGYDYYHLISGADLPIKTLPEFLSFFEKNQGKEFISYYREEDINSYKYRNFFTNSIRTSPKIISLFFRKVNALLIKAQKLLKIDLTKGFDGIPRKCSDWWSITDDCARLILRDEPVFRKYFRHVFCPSELLAQTIVYNSKLKDNIYDITNPNRGSLRLIDWERGTPYTWRSHDFKTIINSENFFGRKFNRHIDSQVMSQVYSHCNKGKKRILVMNIGSGLGGIESSMIPFLKFLVSEGHKVDLYLWRLPGELHSLIPKEVNIINQRLRPPKRPECSSFRDYAEYCKMHIRIMRGKNPIAIFKPFDNFYDIAISYCQNGHSPYYLIDKVSATKKILYYHHGSYDATDKQKKIDLKYYQQYDIIDTISRPNLNMLSAHFPSLKDRMSFSGCMIDVDRIRRMSELPQNIPFDNSTLNICTVARISPEKGISLALETCRILHDAGINFKWIFVGGWVEDYMIECRQFIERNRDMKSKIIFAGDQANPYQFMKQCDIYVQPSLVESYSICIREAAILEKPIITTDIPAFIKAQKEIEGQIISPTDSESLAKNIIGIVNSLDNHNTSFSDSYNESIKSVIRKHLQ